MPDYVLNTIPLNEYESIKDGVYYYPEGILVVAESCIAAWLPWEEVLSNYAKSITRTRTTL